jgi:hypothetical protein
LEHDERSGHVGLNEWCRLVNASINVGFGCKVDDTVATAYCSFDRCGVTNVASHEAVFRIRCDGFQIREIAGVRQFVKIDDPKPSVERENMPDEIGANKSRASCDQDFHGVIF